MPQNLLGDMFSLNGVVLELPAYCYLEVTGAVTALQTLELHPS